jgi:hypothetical protein
MFNWTVIYAVIYATAIIPTIPYKDYYQQRLINTPNSITSNSQLDKYSEDLYNKFSANNTNTKIPLIFAGYKLIEDYVVSGINSVVLELPINDIRSGIVTTLKNDSIKTPELRSFYNDFYSQCYTPARNKFDYMLSKQYIKTDTAYFDGLDDIDANEYNWVGGSYYLKTKGFYKSCPTNNCQPKDVAYPGGITYLQNNKSTLLECKVVWDNYLQPSLFTEFNLDKEYKINSPKLINPIIQSYLEGEKTVDKEEGRDWGFIAAIKEVIGWLMGVIGGGIIAFVKSITTYLITIIIPLLQSFLLFVIVVFLPILLPFSATDPKYLMGILITMFAISFVEVLINIMKVFDNAMLSFMAIPAGNNANAFEQAVYLAGNGQGLEFFLVNLLVLFMYVIVIKLWFEMMSEFGGKTMKFIGREIDSVDDMGITSTVIK